MNVSLQVEPPGQAVLRVLDTGAGISADILGHLFEPFVQGERTIDRSNGGLGLGLALAQGIAQLHGGSITATSDGPGRGAEFTVRLPALSGTSPKLSLVRSEAPSGAARRVLIIEDMRDAAESLQEALDMIGHVARALRSQPVTESALLVALSGYVSQNDVDRARQAGFDEHMAKPPRLDVLEKLLARAGH